MGMVINQINSEQVFSQQQQKPQLQGFSSYSCLCPKMNNLIHQTNYSAAGI